MSSFAQVIPVVLAHEGGFVDNPADDGGPTNYGLTLHDLRFAGYTADTATLKALTPADAAEIYRQNFWLPLNFDLLYSPALALVLFDQTVLDGPKAIQVAQELAGVAADGVIGSETAAALNARDGYELAVGVLKDRVRYYVAIVKNRPDQLQFLTGWVDRIIDLACKATDLEQRG